MLLASFEKKLPISDPAIVLQGLLVVSPEGRIQFATAQAQHWIKDFFKTASVVSQVPDGLTRWLACQPREMSSFTSILGESGKRLGIRMVCREANSFCLLLEQRPRTLMDGTRRVLTPRETEVLSWVALGKTNAQIGEIMGLKTRTIGKYLERIYPKLGVENRTAAASFVGTNRDT